MTLFNSDNEDILIKLNEYYNQCLKMKRKNKNSNSDLLLNINKKAIEDHDERDDDESEQIYRRNREEYIIHDDIIKVLLV